MKILVIAHLDDEVLWFNPQDFDKIVVCSFFRRDNEYGINSKRFKVLERHPLKEKIKVLGLCDGNYWRDKNPVELFALNLFKEILMKILPSEIENASVIYTHNSWGEYGHTDHIAVHEVIKRIAKCPIYCFNGIEEKKEINGSYENIDLEFYKKVKNIYQEEGCWTWDWNYVPKPKQMYFEVL